MSTRTVSVKLLAEISGFVSPLKAAAKAVSDLKGEIGKAASEGKLDKLGASAGRMGLALSGGFLVAATAAARFEKAMSEVDAVAGASQEQMQALSAAALQAGKDTQYSATEAAGAEAELAKAGLSASDILGGALTGSLSLAAAGSLDLEDAATTAAKAMNVFGLSGSDVGHVADVLAAASNKSATDVHDLAMALNMGGLAAKNSGVSLEETIGTFAAFADNALNGSDAGTSFKTMLMMLQAPTEKSAGLMKELGINAYDAQGQFVGIAALAGNLKDKLGPLTQEQRNAALATIFGADAMRAATVLYSEGEQGIREYTAAVDDQGAAAETARKKTDNLQGDIERLTGSLETLFIQAGSGSNSGLRTLVQMLGGIVDVITSLPAPVLTAGTVIIGLAGAGLLAFSAFLKVRGSVREVLDELNNAGPAAQRFGSGLQTATRWATRAALAIAGLKIAAMALDALTDHATDVQGLNDSLRHLGEENQRAGELTRLFGDDLAGFGKDAALAGGGINGVARAIEGTIPGLSALGQAIDGHSFNQAQQNIQAVDQQLADMVRNGNIEAARAAFFQLMQAGKLSAQEMADLMPAYINAMSEAEKTTGAQAAAATVAKEANVKLAGAFGEAASEAEGLQTAFDKLNGKELDWRETQRAAEQAADDLAAALKDSGGSLDVHTEKGRAAAAAVDDLAKAAAAAAQKKYDETGSVQAASAEYDIYIGILRTLLTQAGYTKKYIDDLVASIAAMPTTKTVSINVTTYQRMVSDDKRSLAGKMARGGIVTHAADGVLRDAAVYSPQGPARYAFAEPSTGGEAFIPRRGDHNRSMAILDQAAAWYGARVVPQGWYGGSAAASSAAPTGPAIDYVALGRAVASAMRQSPLQGVVVMDGDRIGQIQGRRADILYRGG